MTKSEQRKLLEDLVDCFLQSGGQITKVAQGVIAVSGEDFTATWAGFDTRDRFGQSRRRRELNSIFGEERRLARRCGPVLHDDYSEESFP